MQDFEYICVLRQSGPPRDSVAAVPGFHVRGSLATMPRFHVRRFLRVLNLHPNLGPLHGRLGSSILFGVFWCRFLVWSSLLIRSGVPLRIRHPISQHPAVRNSALLWLRPRHRLGFALHQLAREEGPNRFWGWLSGWHIDLVDRRFRFRRLRGRRWGRWWVLHSCRNVLNRVGRPLSPFRRRR